MQRPDRLTKRFKVQYAGVPESQRIVHAYTAKEAAFDYFRREMYRNHVFVSRRFREEIFSWKDFQDQVPDFDEKRLVFLRQPSEPTKPRTFWSDLVENILKGPFRTWDWHHRK